jgi:universal stress protein A
MDDINRILVVAKSTKYCKKAVHYGFSIAKKYGAEVVILHVIHNPFGLQGWNLPMAFLPSLKGLPIKEFIIEGDPAKKIFEVVEQEQIDLIVMLAYEQWRVEHWLFGRELDEIVTKMPCSVLLVQKKIGA